MASSFLPSQLHLVPHPFSPTPTLQAGALTGIGASFAEGPIEFYKSQLQIQKIRQQTSPSYKGEGCWEPMGRRCRAGAVGAIFTTLQEAGDALMVALVALVDPQRPPPILTFAAAPFTTLRQAVRASFQANGLRGPFQGLGITIVRNLPANALYMSSFELTKRRLAGWQGCASAVRKWAKESTAFLFQSYNI